MTAHETMVLHAFGALVPVDASLPTSAALPGGAARPGAPTIDAPLELELDPVSQADRDSFPRPRQVIRRRVGWAIDFGEWETLPRDVAPPEREAFDPSHRDERGVVVDRAAVPMSGVVWDVEGRFLARRFSTQLDRGAVFNLGLFPSPARVRFGRDGGLVGSLALADGRALPFAHLIFDVAIVGRGTLMLEAQSDRYGDFAMPLTGMPELPRGATPLRGRLRVRGRAPPPGFDPERLVDPAALLSSAVDVALLAPATLRNAGGGFDPDLSFQFRAGEIQTVIAGGGPLVAAVV